MLYKKDSINKIIIKKDTIKKPIDIKLECPICKSVNNCKDREIELPGWIHEKRIFWIFS